MLGGSVDKPHYVSHIALVPKRNNKFCLIQNLRPVRGVNDSCCKVTFHCEDIKTVAQLIEHTGDLVTVDIKNGFHHIKIHSLYCRHESLNNIKYKSHLYKNTKAIDTISISYQPLWYCCWRGDITSFFA